MAKKIIEPSADKYLESSHRLLPNWVNVRVMGVVETDKMRLLLHDGITGLPTVSLVIDEIDKTLSTHTQVGLIYIELEKTPRLQEALSREAFEHLIDHVASLLQTFKGQVIRADDTITAVMRNGNKYAIIMSPPRKNQNIAYDDLITVRNRLLRSLREKIRSTVDQNLFRKLHLIAGVALIDALPGQAVDMVLAEALESAQAHAAEREMDRKEVELDLLRLALRDEAISVVFQPVADIATRQPIGYEALSRGPEGIEQPEYLFKLAIEADLGGQLDRVCREIALRQAKGMPDGKMFINLHPLSVIDPDFLEMAGRLKAGDYGISVDRVVFELSENYMTYDPATFREALEVLQSNGLGVCIDDAGSGYYMGLELIAHAKPEYVKINGNIIRDIDKDEVKRELAETITKFAGESGSAAIAMAVETPEELGVLKNLGVKYAQGYLFAKPAPGFPDISS